MGIRPCCIADSSRLLPPRPCSRRTSGIWYFGSSCIPHMLARMFHLHWPRKPARMRDKSQPTSIRHEFAFCGASTGSESGLPCLSRLRSTPLYAGTQLSSPPPQLMALASWSATSVLEAEVTCCKLISLPILRGSADSVTEADYSQPSAKNIQDNG